MDVPFSHFDLMGRNITRPNTSLGEVFVLHMKALFAFFKIYVFGLICSKEGTDENLYSVFFCNSCFVDEHSPAISLENWIVQREQSLLLLFLHLQSWFPLIMKMKWT